jgi:DNA-binding NarL/FixJ family response regulator
VTKAKQTTLKVLVVDDHPMLRRVVVLACADADNLEVVGEAADGEEALAKVAETEPDVIVLDLVLPKLDGFEVARRLRDQGNKAHILVLTGRDDPDALFEAVRAGVDGFLDKRSSAEDIMESIRGVAEGKRLFTAEQEAKAILKLRQVVDRARENSAVSGLTTRELEVLHLIGEGLTTYQMGARLELSARTVESHIARTYRKLQVKTRMEAVSKARRLGLLEDHKESGGHDPTKPRR